MPGSALGWVLAPERASGLASVSVSVSDSDSDSDLGLGLGLGSAWESVPDWVSGRDLVWAQGWRPVSEPVWGLALCCSSTGGP